MPPASPASIEQERQRLDFLRSLHVLDTPAEPAFDSLAARAAQACAAPAAAVSLVDEHRCWLKASLGLGVASVPREPSYCGAHFASSSVFELPDALADPRFRDLPIANGPAGFRFYAGAPLIASRGFSLGTICVLDHPPRRLTEFQRDLLASLAAEAVVLLESRPGAVAAPPARETVLIVEDDGAVRQFAAEVLRRAGYRPLTANDGSEGLSLWRQHRHDVAVVLTDLNMPGMNGAELVRRLRAEPSPPPVVVMSGHVNPTVRKGLLIDGVAAIVEKPFLIESLVAAVTRAAVHAR